MLPEHFFAWLLKNEDFFSTIMRTISDNRSLNMFSGDPVVNFIADKCLDYYNKYNKPPSFEVLKNEISGFAHEKKAMEFLSMVEEVDINSKDLEWALDSAEKFLKKAAVVVAVEEAYKLIVDNKNPHYDSIVPVMEQAVSMSIDKDFGHNYFYDWRERVSAYNSKEKTYPFFLNKIQQLTGGFREISLNVVASRTGGGKTMFLVNQALHNLKQGKSILYITFEDGAIGIARRFDAVLNNIPLKILNRGIDEREFYDRFVKSVKKIRGKPKFFIKEMMSGTTAVSLKSFIKEMENKHGNIDVVFVDYLNLMRPSMAVDSRSLYLTAGQVAIELRDLSKTLGKPIWTATQLNREASVQEDPSAEGISQSKIVSDTADFICIIVSDKNLRKEKRAIVKIAKSRYGGEQSTMVVSADPDTGVISEPDRETSATEEQAPQKPDFSVF